MPILETRELSKSFGRLQAVHRVSLRVDEGELVALIGPNGAGKTTLFNLISGRLPPTEGQVFFDGREITRMPAFQITRLGIARTFQITNIFPDLTVRQNILMSVLARRGETLQMLRHERNMRDALAETERILAVLGLQESGETPCNALSHADQRLVEIGIALGSRPRLLLLDEPTAGMAPAETQSMVAFVRQMATAEGVTVLLTEHDMDVVFSVAQRIVVMHQGRIIADGKPGEVRGDAKVREAYLGELD